MNIRDRQVFEGQRLLSAAVVNEMHRGQALFPGLLRSSPILPDETVHFWSYGLGWFLTDYRGRKLVMHGGASSAFTALVPEENLAVAIVTNLPTVTWLSPVNVNWNSLPSALLLRILDIYLGGPERDWSGEYLAWVEANSDPFNLRDRSRVLGTNPSAPLRHYVAVYAHPAFGEVTVTEERGALVFRFLPPYTTGDLAHWHYDVFQVNWRRRRPSQFLTFTHDSAGEVDALSMDEVGVFTRIR